MSNEKKLLVISDTGVFKTNSGFNAFGPVVKELEHLLEVFDEITWIGFNKKNQSQNKSFINVNGKRIHIIALTEVGGKSFISKLNIIFHYPIMFVVILREIIKHKYIHTRAPSNPAVIAMFLSYFFSNKTFWHKYAGSWIDKASYFYEQQRLFLKKLNKNSLITINGNYEMNNQQFFSFENPCLDLNDRVFGNEIVSKKVIKGKINFCFVGALNEHKGVRKIIESFTKIDSEKIGVLHFVGDGEDKEVYLKLSEKIKYEVIFHGFLAKDKIKDVYSKTHFILLPSKSEGFPKVIGEAMNYGCIPIVSDVSCIDQYIKDGENGFLLKYPTTELLIESIKKAIVLDKKLHKKWIEYNYSLAQKFTYNYYNSRIKTEIFK